MALALRAPAASKKYYGKLFHVTRRDIHKDVNGKNDPVIFFEPARVTHPIEQPIILMSVTIGLSLACENW